MSDRPVPTADSTSEPYWQALRDRRFVLPYCTACDRSHFYPRQVCPFCGSLAVAWRAASGNGTIYSLTRVHRAPHPAFAERTPYVVALVALAEGPRLMASITDGVADAVRIGDPVEIDFEFVSADLTLPAFRRSKT